MSFKFIHAADLHLDSPLLGLSKYPGAPDELARGATRRALEKLVDLAIAEQVAFVLIAGDVYDGDWKDYNTGVFFSAQMSRLNEALIDVYLIRGNHDASSQISRELKLPKNVHELSHKHPETIVIPHLNLAIHGQGFATQAVTHDIASSYPSAKTDLFNIGILHTSASGYAGHENYAPCSVTTLISKGYDYWALGHVHQFKILCESPYIVFSGNTQGRNIRETGVKGCVLVTADHGQVSSVQHIRLDTMQWLLADLDVTDTQDIDQVVARVVRYLRHEVFSFDALTLIAVRVILSGACFAHAAMVSDEDRLLAELRSALSEEFGGRVWLERLKIRTRPNIDIDAVADRDDPIGRLVRSVRDAASDSLLLEELLSQFSDLKDRLPSVLTYSDSGLDLTSVDAITSRLPDVERDLASYLLTDESVL